MKARETVAAMVCGVGLALAAVPALGQHSEFRLSAEGQWEQVRTPTPGSDEALIAEARRFLADEEAGKARDLLDDWISKNEVKDHPLMPQALLLRGDAITADGNEYTALYEYERILKQYPSSEEYVTSLERELEIGVRYAAGMKRKFLGIRWMPAGDIAEELLISVQERLPGSRLAERAGIELGDYYYRTSDLKMADEAYELFLVNYPNSAYRERALKGRIYSSIGRYKGPEYDGAALLDASVLIQRYSSLYPEEAAKSGLNDALVARLDESAAMEMLESSNWYLKQRDEISAKYTLLRLIQKHRGTAAAEKAQRLLEEKGWLAPRPSETGPLPTAVTPGPSTVSTPTPSAGPTPGTVEASKPAKKTTTKPLRPPSGVTP